MIIPTRSAGRPLTFRLAAPITLLLVSACTSTSSVRDPCIAAVSTLPDGGLSPLYRSANSRPGSRTSASPPPVISNSPTSWVEPKRFLMQRTTRWAW